MSKKQKYNPSDLEEWMEFEHTLTCSNCDTQSSVYNNDYNPEKEFFEEGWRATPNGNCYCPKCVSKKLKNK